MSALVEESLAAAELTSYNVLTQDESCHMDQPVERSGLTSSEVLAGLFDLERKGAVGQLPGKQFLKVLL
jgi:predicted Rossmann fold nucleotide-binding protein DprA/Smf involved in DNA uptake